MKKMNKVVMMALTGALVLPMMATSVSAAEEDAPGTGQTEVQYDNTNSIPDPEQPSNPDWTVDIPSSVVFTDGTAVIDVDVELRSVNDGALPATPVTVTVESTNAYKLALPDPAGEGGNTSIAQRDPVSYAVKYGSTVMNDTVNTVGTLTEATPTATGTATLTGTATQIGLHKDTLTYTITVQPATGE